MVGGAPREGVNAGEVTGFTYIDPDTIVELGVDFIRLPLQLLGSIFRELGDGRLRGVPDSRPVLVQVCRGAGEPAKRRCHTS